MAEGLSNRASRSGCTSRPPLSRSTSPGSSTSCTSGTSRPSTGACWPSSTLLRGELGQGDLGPDRGALAGLRPDLERAAERGDPVSGCAAAFEHGTAATVVGDHHRDVVVDGDLDVRPRWPPRAWRRSSAPRRRRSSTAASIDGSSRTSGTSNVTGSGARAVSAVTAPRRPRLVRIDGCSPAPSSRRSSIAARASSSAWATSGVPTIQRHLERDHDVDQSLLRAVVEVAAQPAALRVGGFERSAGANDARWCRGTRRRRRARPAARTAPRSTRPAPSSRRDARTNRPRPATDSPVSRGRSRGHSASGYGEPSRRWAWIVWWLGRPSSSRSSS